MSDAEETLAVAERYARRSVGDRYSPLRPEVWQALQERQRKMLRLLAADNPEGLASKNLVEVGCGSGGNLLDLLRWGFAPGALTGLELLPERQQEARRVLPPATNVWLGDALVAPIGPGSCDYVLQSTVFSSLLDDAFQQRLAQAMWSWVRPGGAVIWYDFTFDNPRNPDVRGVPMRRVRELFPRAVIRASRLTLAPPLARVVCRWHPGLYGVLNRLPALRTHVLAWIRKPVVA